MRSKCLRTLTLSYRRVIKHHFSASKPLAFFRSLLLRFFQAPVCCCWGGGRGSGGGTCWAAPAQEEAAQQQPQTKRFKCYSDGMTAGPALYLPVAPNQGLIKNRSLGGDGKKGAGRCGGGVMVPLQLLTLAVGDSFPGELPPLCASEGANVHTVIQQLLGPRLCCCSSLVCDIPYALLVMAGPPLLSLSLCLCVSLYHLSAGNLGRRREERSCRSLKMPHHIHFSSTLSRALALTCPLHPFSLTI